MFESVLMRIIRVTLLIPLKAAQGNSPHKVLLHEQEGKNHRSNRDDRHRHRHRKMWHGRAALDREFVEHLRIH